MSDVMSLHQMTEKYAEKLTGKLSKQESTFLGEGSNSKAIPQPQLSVRHHRDQGEEGLFLTELVIPATNFTTNFLRIDYLEYKKALDENN
eukprot:11546027-Ditylum_brightwellii.AAC.1